MKRSLGLGLLWLAWVTLLCAAHGQVTAGDPVAQEWQIRALSVDSGRIDLAPKDAWTEQVNRLEALRRRLELGRDDRLVEADVLRLTELLEHAAPNVRAEALACLELVGFAEWSAATIAKLAKDPLPEVRTRLCSAVSAKSWRENLVSLTELAVAGDEGVRSAARTALFGLGGPAAAAAQAELLERVLASEGVRAYLFEIERWSRVSRATGIRVPAPHAEGFLLDLDEDGDSLRAARALWLVACSSALDKSDAEVVARGWGIPLDPSWSNEHRTQRRLLLAAARRSGEVLAIELLAAIARTAEEEPSSERELLLESLFEGVLEAASTSWILPRLESLALDELDVIRFWSIAGVGEADFEPAMLEAWLAKEHTGELRVSIADILVSVFARTRDAEALSGLAKLLRDAQPEVREIAMEALSSAPSAVVNTIGDRFFESWKLLGTEPGLAFLRRLPREGSLPVFRNALLELGEIDELRRAHLSILELLGKFEGDEKCATRLSAWLHEDAAGLTEKLAEPEHREVEIAARGGVRALHSVAGEAAVPQLSETLAQVLLTSMDVAKTCAWSLGRTRLGLRELEPYLDEVVPTRIRVEAALALARSADAGGRERASSALAELYETCDDELRGRILGVFAQKEAEVGRELAHRIFTESGSTYGAAAQALDVLRAVLARDPSDANLEQFVEYIELATSQATRRLVIEILGQSGDPRIRSPLEERLLRGPEALGAERQELLVALARIAPDSPVLWKELWRLPLESAGERLEERFRGKIPAAVAFSFRGEIEALKVISLAGAWPSAEPEGLSRLDGQLALSLAEACREGGDDGHAVRLERIALVALAGELPNEKARLAALHARTRLWRSAEVAGRLLETAQLAERLYADWVRGTISERDLETLLGSFDPNQGRDPLARLTSSAIQARARLAAGAGDFEGARRLLSKASTRLGYSATARERQAALERELR